MVQKNEIVCLFEGTEKKLYKKKGEFLFRPSVPGETILTIVSGKLETLKTAAEKDIIIRNIEIGSSAETYIIKEEIFKNRYEITQISYLIDNQTWLKCFAKGWVEAFCYSGETIEFMAPWGEKMMCESGDFIARPVPGEPQDIYRIERNTFLQTYHEK